MNRNLYRLQHTQRECNAWWLTWSRDQRNKRELERQQLVKDILFFLFFVAVALAIYWGVPV